MAETVTRHEVKLERISFKDSTNAVRHYSDAKVRARSCKLRRQFGDDSPSNLARDLVRLGPHRTKPRVVKRSPKPYPFLNQPWHRFQEISYRSRRWTSRLRNDHGYDSGPFGTASFHNFFSPKGARLFQSESVWPAAFREA